MSDVIGYQIVSKKYCPYYCHCIVIDKLKVCQAYMFSGLYAEKIAKSLKENSLSLGDLRKEVDRQENSPV